MQQQNDNSGVLFKNDKQGNDKRPDYTGKCVIDGVQKRIAAWIKEGAKGKFMSLVFSDPQSPGRSAANSQQGQQPYPRTRQSIQNQPRVPSPIQEGTEFDQEEIPF